MPLPHNTPAAQEPMDVSPADRHPDIHHTIEILMDRIWIIVLCVVFAVLVGAVHLRRSPRLYSATATVQVEQQEQKVVKIEQVVQEDLRSLDAINTIVQKLCSRPLLARVIQTNQLDKSAMFADPKRGGSPDIEVLVSRLQTMVKTSLRRNTRLVDITVTCTDPKLAAIIANSIVNEYMSQDFQQRAVTTKGAYGFLNEEAERLKTKLESSEQALQKYREEVGSVSVEQSQESVTPKLQQYNSQLTQSRAEKLRLKAIYDQIISMTNQVEALLAIPQIASEPAISSARQNAVNADAAFAAVQMRYKLKHPKYQQAASQAEEAKKALQKAVMRLPETYRIACDTAQSTEDNLAKALRDAEAQALKLSSQAIRFNMLSREVDADRALFNAVLNRMKETSVSTELQSEKIKMIQPAIESDTPVSPKVMLIVMASIFGGLMAGVMIVMGLNALDRSIRSVDDAESYLGLPVLSLIPRLKLLNNNSVLVANEGANSTGAEAYRTLRTSISMLGREETRRTFLFTSATPQEGKTFNSINFSAAMAQQGLKTLLIDADLRRPSVEEDLTGKTEHVPGVTDYLTGQKKFEEILLSVPDHPNLSWIAAGKTAPNPAELLTQDGLMRLIKEGLQRYDRVVVDSAPVNAVSDTLVFCHHIQTTVLVLRSHRTPRKAVLRALQMLKTAGANVSGLVLNMQPVHWGKGYYYRDSYHYYGYSHYHYGEDHQKKKKRRSSKSRPPVPKE